MFEFIDVKYKNILDIPHLEIEKGEITTLIGESGGGKTTILTLLNKINSPTQGKVLFNGIDLSQIDTVMHRRKVTMLSQNPIIFEGDIRDNLVKGLKYQDKPMVDYQALEELLQQVQLNKELDAPADNLSGGEKQRLALARILLLDSPVYLLDEPSSALDDNTETLIIDMITEHVRKNNKTLVMVTHSKKVAKKYSDVIINIKNGHCILEGE